MNNYDDFHISHPFVGLLLFIFEFEIERKFSSLIEFARRTNFTAYSSGVSIRNTPPNDHFRLGLSVCPLDIQEENCRCIAQEFIWLKIVFL